MAKSQALINAEAKIKALEARLSLAVAVYKNQKAHIADLEAQLNARGATKVVPPVKREPIVTTFTRRDGTVCERIRTGNRSVIREVQLPECSLPGIEVVWQ